MALIERVSRVGPPSRSKRLSRGSPLALRGRMLLAAAAAGTACVGASLTGLMVVKTVSTSDSAAPPVLPLSLVVIVKLTEPLKSATGLKVGCDAALAR